MRPHLRLLWEHKLKSCETTQDNWLSLKYDNSSTDYLAKYSCLLEKSGTKHKKFLIVEDVLINRGI